MKNQIGFRRLVGGLLLCLGILTGNLTAFAGDDASLLSVSVTNNTPVMPRTIFTQTWTFQNTGTTTWTAGSSGYTLCLVGKDSLGAIPLTANTASSRYVAFAVIGSGKSVASGGQASFSLMFIAPETAGTFADTFQLRNSSGTNFGPQVTVQVVVEKAGSTNQYDRSRAISYANNYAGYVVTDGYFWTNGSGYGYFGAGANVPTSPIGDDCAHFVSCCIGTQTLANRGGGLSIPTRVPPTYGEPGAAHLVTNLIGSGWAEEVSSLSQMEPGDVIGWNWEGDTNINNLDHVTLYLGNGLTASHARSALDVNLSFFKGSSSDIAHYVHIFDAPTLNMTNTGNNFVLSWGANWTTYALYSSSSMAPNATWTKVTKSPTKVNGMNVLTNTMTTGPVFYRLVMP